MFATGISIIALLTSALALRVVITEKKEIENVKPAKRKPPAIREPFTFYVDPDLSPYDAMSYFPPWDEEDDDAQTDRGGPENTGN